MGVVTISIGNETEKKLRDLVGKTGKGKGALGRSIQQAIESWVEKQNQESIRKQALERLEKGYRMGKILYKERAELYERI